MKPIALTLFATLLFSSVAASDTLGFIEQTFGAIYFAKGKWDRTVNSPCYTYSANVDGATVEIMRYGLSNLVQFKATKGLKVTVCTQTAAFDEGFETAKPLEAPTTK